MNWNQQQDNPYGSPAGQYQQAGGQYDPYARKSSGSGLMWLWLILGGGGLVMLVCCGACCGLAWVGMEDEEKQLQAMFEDHPVVVENIGNIQSVERDWIKSMDDDDDSIWYYNVSGDQGDAVIVIKEAPFNLNSDELEIEWAKLLLESGEEFEIYP